VSPSNVRGRPRWARSVGAPVRRWDVAYSPSLDENPLPRSHVLNAFCKLRRAGIWRPPGHVRWGCCRGRRDRGLCWGGPGVVSVVSVVGAGVRVGDCTSGGVDAAGVSALVLACAVSGGSARLRATKANNMTPGRRESHH
jgi:hypothetical protein